MKGQSGFGLVEVLVSAGLLGLLSLGVMKLMEGSYKTSADLNDRQELRDIRDEFYSAIKTGQCGLLDVVGNETFEKRPDLTLDLNSKEGLVLKQMYGRHGQKFSPDQSYGRITVDGEEKAFRIGPLTRNSPLVSALPDSSKKGEYYDMGNGRIAAEIRISLLKKSTQKDENGNYRGGGPVVLKFLTILTMDGDKITDCKSAANLSSAQNNCLGLNGEDGEVEDGFVKVEWIEKTGECEISAIPAMGGDDVYGMDEAGNVDPSLYVLSNIITN